MKKETKILTVKCPRCGAMARWEGNAYKPFCSARCQNVDLGAWVDEEYSVPADFGPEDVDGNLSEIYTKTTSWS